jgi:hypothetical protein
MFNDTQVLHPPRMFERPTLSTMYGVKVTLNGMTPTPNFIKMHKFDETLIGQAERQTEG